jgi:hypothetical protein
MTTFYWLTFETPPSWRASHGQNTLNIYILCFSFHSTFVPNFIPRINILRDIYGRAYRSPCKVFQPDNVSYNSQIPNFMKICPETVEGFHAYGWLERSWQAPSRIANGSHLSLCDKIIIILWADRPLHALVASINPAGRWICEQQSPCLHLSSYKENTVSLGLLEICILYIFNTGCSGWIMTMGSPE